MNNTWNRIVLGLVVVVAIGGLTLMSQLPTVSAQPKVAGPVSPAHYTVVETQGHNLLVTDNVSNTLYFYTVDKDQPVGSELKLRGSLDLNNVGKLSLKPVTVAPAK